MNPKAILICVGSELLRGKMNTHASYVAKKLASIGLSLHEENTVSDEQREIASALQRALDHFQIVIVSGGLGPTFDDLTREAASEATGKALGLSAALLKMIRAKFRRAHYRMPLANVRQAYLLEGARPLSNGLGTAPGQWLEINKSSFPAVAGGESSGGPLPAAAGDDKKGVLILLPGPPRELYPMVERDVLPRLKKLYSSTARAETHMHFVGVPESVVDAKVRPIIEKASRGKDHVEFTILAHLGLVDFDVFVSSVSSTRARGVVSRIADAVRRAVGDFWYGSDASYPLEKVVGERFRARHATLATAESCTGGLLAARLTDVPGSSEYFHAGWVTYADGAKMQTLGVEQSLLRKYGAVSKPVALAMARGVRERAGTTWGLGITGIAGPSGGSPAKPVGLVHIALFSKNGSVSREYRFVGERDAVRQRAVLAALDLLRRI